MHALKEFLLLTGSSEKREEWVGVRGYWAAVYTTAVSSGYWHLLRGTWISVALAKGMDYSQISDVGQVREPCWIVTQQRQVWCRDQRQLPESQKRWEVCAQSWKVYTVYTEYTGQCVVGPLLHQKILPGQGRGRTSEWSASEWEVETKARRLVIPWNRVYFWWGRSEFFPHHIFVGVRDCSDSSIIGFWCL